MHIDGDGPIVFAHARHHDYTEDKKAAMEGLATFCALSWNETEEPRRTNVGAPPTINVKVTRQWIIEV